MQDMQNALNNRALYLLSVIRRNSVPNELAPLFIVLANKSRNFPQRKFGLIQGVLK
jgi:hypothetical protein